MKLFSVHRSSFVIGSLMTVVMLAIAMPGWDSSGFWPPAVVEPQVHGWPLPFLERGIHFRASPPESYHSNYPSQPVFGVPALSLNAWKVWQGEVEFFSLANFVVDLACVVGIVLSIILAWEWRRRRRRSATQFTLAELLLCITALGTISAWAAWHERQYRCELPHVKALESTEDLPLVILTDESIAPLWLRRLAGDDNLPRFFWRSQVAYITLQTSERNSLSDLMPHLIPLKHLKSVALVTPARSYRRPIAFDLLRRISRLEELDLGGCNIEPLGISEAKQLIAISQLKKLSVSNRASLNDEARVAILRHLPACEIDYYDQD